MKRTALLLFAILMLFPLASCGSTESEYRYDNIPELVLDEDSFGLGSSRPIIGGAFAPISPQAYKGEDVREEESGKNKIFVLFDEKTKTLTPFCYDYTCEHIGPECFAYALSWASDGYWNIIDDTIVVVNNTFSHYIVGDLPAHELYAFYFSFDGTLIEKISFDMNTLVRKDGNTVSFPLLGATCISINNKLYVDVYDQGDTTDTNRLKNRWVVCYDFEQKEFSPVSNYVLPSTSDSSYVRFMECNETEIGVSCEKRFAYVINLEDGRYEETDCANVYDELIADGLAKQGSSIELLYPLSNIMLDNSFPSNYYDIKTGEKLDSKVNDNLNLLWKRHYYYNSETWFKVDGNEDNNKYRTANDRETINVSRYFEDGAYYIYGITIESENGFIFQYIDGTKHWMDAWNNEYYTVNENGREVVYQKAPRLIYVTKDDYFDGQIDEPWYYDAETGMFVQ